MSHNPHGCAYCELRSCIFHGPGCQCSAEQRHSLASVDAKAGPEPQRETVPVPRETFALGRIELVPSELPLGYICEACGRWVPTLSTIDPDCRHERVSLPENATAYRLMSALAKAGYLRIPLPEGDDWPDFQADGCVGDHDHDEPEIHDDEYGQARDFERIVDSLPPDFRL